MTPNPHREAGAELPIVKRRDISVIADAMKPILRGIVNRDSKDGFEFWVDNMATDLARAAGEASHHVELVCLLKEARWYVKDGLIDEIDALLAKLEAGGDAK